MEANVLTAIVSLLGVYIFLVGAIVAWTGRKVWKLSTKDIPQIRTELRGFQQSMVGNPKYKQTGFTEETEEDIRVLCERMDSVEKQIKTIRGTLREDHRMVMNSLRDIIGVLKIHNINGDLPRIDDDSDD